MKKAIALVSVFVVFLIIYFIQSNFFSWFNIADVKPNLFIILIIFLGLFAGKNVATIFGFIIGIFLDIFIGKTFGITSLMYALIGLISGYFNKSFSKDSKITIMLIIMGATFIFEFVTYIINSIILKSDIEWLYFLKIILIEIIFNMLITIIIYPLIQFNGYFVEKTFKGERKLTRYF